MQYYVIFNQHVCVVGVCGNASDAIFSAYNRYMPYDIQCHMTCTEHGMQLSVQCMEHERYECYMYSILSRVCYTILPSIKPPPLPPPLPPSLPPTATLDMKIPVDGLFFVGTQLVAISNTGKVAVWQSVQQHWQV